MDAVCGLGLPWEKLQGRTILISGATGMIGSTLIHVLMKKNHPGNSEQEHAITENTAASQSGIASGGQAKADMLHCTVIALGRSEKKARERFLEYWEDPEFHFAECNVDDAASLREGLAGLAAHMAGAGSAGGPDAVLPDRAADGAASAPDRFCRKDSDLPHIDYVFHAASNTHPVAYATDPIGTVVTNIIGLNNLLALASDCGCRRFVYASSNEIYGENRGDVDRFDESYCGYIDCNTMRAGYPESKRAGEALCQAYIRQKNLDCAIVRFTRSFGPSMLMSDTKAISQFIRKGVSGENVVLKSAGEQLYSYTYVSDAVAGFLTVLLKGECGEAYNVADERCDIRLKDLAGIIADFAGTKVVFEIPDATEQAGYSKATKALLDSSKLKKLGWKAQFDMRTGLEHTMRILKELQTA